MSNDSAGVFLANSNNGSWQLQNYIEHNTPRLFWQHLSRRFSSSVCWWWSHTAHSRMTDSLLSALVYLS